jgi:hypothetical protein
MKINKIQLTKYLQKHGDIRPVEPHVPAQTYDGAVVIPCLAESESLPRTLNSLAACDAKNVMILLVVNQAPGTDAVKSADNQLTLQRLRDGDYPEQLNLFWIDAASPGKEILRGGVGAARKTGMDTALQFLKPESLLFCLDGDTLVEPGYLSNTFEFFTENPDAAAGVCDFRHQTAANPIEQAAIIEYELYMRYYELGLALAGSPFAYQAMGSAIVAPTAAYIKAGGMRAKNAGEDFYFLQALRKFGLILEIKKSTVHPAARPSDRVPFGTGAKIRQIAGGAHIAFHNPKVFLKLKHILETVKCNCESPASLPEQLNEPFFTANNFPSAWANIIRNTPNQPDRIESAFHTWFDAFRNLKYIHFLEQEFVEDYPALDVDNAFAELYAAFNIPIADLPKSPAEQLDYLR